MTTCPNCKKGAIPASTLLMANLYTQIRCQDCGGIAELDPAIRKIMFLPIVAYFPVMYFWIKPGLWLSILGAIVLVLVCTVLQSRFASLRCVNGSEAFSRD